jgi:osmotically-inducible protein OsmY
MKTDTQLHRDIVDELKWEPNVNDAEVGVAVKGGVVTLTGKVGSYAQKYAAERVIERVSGVRAIADDLQVRIPGDKARSDTEIAHAVLQALQWDVEVPDDKLTVKVENGFVVLEGKTDWYYEKAAAERAVRYLTGVKGVINRIHVAPKASTTEVKSKIESALKRSAELDAKRITVETSGDRVTLRGYVRSWAERKDAENAAWAAPGVKEVDDELVVAL